MKKPAMSLLLLALASVSSAAMADSWKHENGKGRHGREYKQVYWDGHCKVEQKWKKGEYKEKRKCKRPERHYVDRRYDERYYGRPVVRQHYYPASSHYYPDYGRHERRDPQVNIDIRIRQ
ncbi:hypothetical protein [Massilia varians]|uniref:hypothetical protein n=1 Tax=Massilia varians TaxID=457921 RepID=UPI002553648C|nr:hypothetical protein [Massilia varians]MDK6078508.1 hypothetical protein [Massilia varians]